MIPPNLLGIPDIGIMSGTLGKAEQEAAAAILIRLHHFHEWTEWHSFRLSDLAAMLETDEVTRKWVTAYGVVHCNPDFKWLIDHGHLTELKDQDQSSDKVGLLTVTEKFTDAMKRWGKRRLGPQEKPEYVKKGKVSEHIRSLEPRLSTAARDKYASHFETEPREKPK